MNQHLLQPGKLLDDKGYLFEPGYATSLVKEYNRQEIKGGSTRIKEWDYYLIYDNEYAIALTIADNSYMGMCSVTYLDFINFKETTKSPMTWLTFGKTGFPSSSAVGDVAVSNKQIDISFKHQDGKRRLQAKLPNFEAGAALSIDLELTDEPADSMVIATPFPKKQTAFYYNQKIIGMRAKGTVTMGNKSHSFNPDTAFGLLDWGRGVWTYKNTWYWGAGHGIIDGKVFGFNIGYGFGDTSAASENMLFYDGTAHKLDKLSFNIPKTADGHDDFMNPWTFTSSDKRFEMNFTPILDRKSLTDFKLLCSDQHQVFGWFDGKAALDDGRILDIRHFLGFAEKVFNKW